uniref:Uncharacterized protein n=1 Tax=Calidris pygmaea TaxID=425635 RepID=A0A8C3PPE0_9CHAR
MAALAYTLGKREINYYFSVRSAKALALGAVLLLTACHAASRRYRGEGAAAGAPRGKEICPANLSYAILFKKEVKVRHLVPSAVF